MTAPKNAILPGQNWGFCPSPVQKFRQNRHLTSSISGCFGSLISQNFWHHRTGPLFEFLPTAAPAGVFSLFFTFPPPQTCPTCPTFARRLPDVLCPTLPDVCPTFAYYPKNPRSWRSHFFKIWAPPGKWRCLFSFEKKNKPPKKT